MVTDGTAPTRAGGLPPDLARLAGIGWHLYPCRAHHRACSFAGAPALATPDPDQLARWQAEYPGCSWRVACGPSRIVAIDVDRPGGNHTADGIAAMAALVGAHGPLPPRPTVRTGGSGGLCLFFAHDGEQLRGESGVPAPGIDPHRGAQSIMVPPSRHPRTGGPYRWIVPPWEVAPPPLPPWLATLLRPAPVTAPTHAWRPNGPRASAAIMHAVHAVRVAPGGAANDTLNRAAFRLGTWVGAGFISGDTAMTELHAAATLRKIPIKEALATIRSGLEAGRRNPVVAHDA